MSIQHMTYLWRSNELGQPIKGSGGRRPIHTPILRELAVRLSNLVWRVSREWLPIYIETCSFFYEFRATSDICAVLSKTSVRHERRLITSGKVIFFHCSALLVVDTKCESPTLEVEVKMGDLGPGQVETRNSILQAVLVPVLRCLLWDNTMYGITKVRGTSIVVRFVQGRIGTVRDSFSRARPYIKCRKTSTFSPSLVCPCDYFHWFHIAILIVEVRSWETGAKDYRHHSLESLLTHEKEEWKNLAKVKKHFLTISQQSLQPNLEPSLSKLTSEVQIWCLQYPYSWCIEFSMES